MLRPRILTLLLLSLSATLGAACSQLDNGSELDVPDARACVPAVCSATMCGAVADGCGGQLSCGICAAEACTKGTLEKNVVATSNQDVDALRGYTTIKGNVFVARGVTSLGGLACLEEVTSDVSVSDSGVTTLAGLDALRTVGGALSIQRNGALTTLAGLGALAHAGRVSIFENKVLGAVAGLDALVDLRGALSIERNPVLDSVGGFRLLRDAEDVFIEDNPKLRSITIGGSSAALRGDLVVQKNPLLRRIGGEAGFGRIDGELILVELPLLDEVSGLNSITEIGGGANVYDTGLRDLSALRGLRSLGENPKTDRHYLEVNDNAALLTLDGIGAPSYRLGTLGISGNPRLTSTAGLAHLRSASTLVVIANNASLTSLEGLSLEEGACSSASPPTRASRASQDSTWTAPATS
jgi:hypothetical protein